jgi:hypothetical protein
MLNVSLLIILFHSDSRNRLLLLLALSTLLLHALAAN